MYVCIQTYIKADKTLYMEETGTADINNVEKTRSNQLYIYTELF